MNGESSLREVYEVLIAPQLHARCAEVLAACTSIRRTGCVAELRMFALADESRRKREIDRRPRTVTEALHSPPSRLVAHRRLIAHHPAL